MTNTGLRANTITRTLRAADLVVLPSGTPAGREGIRVSQGYNARQVVVTVDIDAPHREREITEAVRDALTAKAYTVEPNPYDAAILTITKG